MRVSGADTNYYTPSRNYTNKTDLEAGKKMKADAKNGAEFE